MVFDGNMDNALISEAVVNVYVVRMDDPSQLPIQVGSVTPTAATGGGVDWKASVNVPISGLYPLDYKLYATVNDGFNSPVQSASSTVFTPDFAVHGDVANQNGDALAGWTVYLDYNGTGVPAANDPSVITNQAGFFGFPSAFASATGWAPVPVGKPVNVLLVVPSDDYVPEQNPVSVTYDGSHPEVADFTVDEKSAITGTVFVDTGNNGIAGDGTPIPGATVMLKPGGQTAVTDTTGKYTFNIQQPGSYTVQYQPPAASVVQAISAPDGTPGTSYGGTDGDSFTTTSTVEITSLGVFTGGNSGSLHGTLTAVLYDAVTHKIMAQISFTGAASGTQMGDYDFKALPSPVFVYAGFQGMIAAYGFT